MRSRSGVCLSSSTSSADSRFTRLAYHPQFVSNEVVHTANGCDRTQKRSSGRNPQTHSHRRSGANEKAARRRLGRNTTRRPLDPYAEIGGGAGPGMRIKVIWSTVPELVAGADLVPDVD